MACSSEHLKATYMACIGLKRHPCGRAVRAAPLWSANLQCCAVSPPDSACQRVRHTSFDLYHAQDGVQGQAAADTACSELTR